MHILVRETRGLDEAEPAIDLRHSPADLVFLSFSDSDLGAWRQRGQRTNDTLPSLRLANLARLKHPMSVDLYVERVIENARCVIVRLLGGLDYWRYGAEELAHAARKAGIALALLPGDGRDDPRLAELSTVSEAGARAPRPIFRARRSHQHDARAAIRRASRRPCTGPRTSRPNRCRCTASMILALPTSLIVRSRSSCFTAPIFWPAISRRSMRSLLRSMLRV